MNCTDCKQQTETISAVVQGVYYSDICRSCISKKASHSSFSSGFQSYDRRRQYEDYAQDTVQPYDAMGKPRTEFYRLYPNQAAKIFTKGEIEQVRKQI